MIPRPGIGESPILGNKVVVAGDWHSNTRYIPQVVARIRERAPDARFLIHAGDFNIGHGELARKQLLFTEAMFETTSIERAVIVLGNHDDWGRFRSSEAWRRGEPHQLDGTRFYAAPRAHVLTGAGRRILLFGGAASLQDRRVEDSNWWPEELASETEYDAAGQVPNIDILITHEAPDGATTATAAFERGQNPNRFAADRVVLSAASRDRTTRLSDVLLPALHFHGHLHFNAEGTLPEGRKVISLGQDEQRGNLALLDLETLTWNYI